MTPRKYVTGQPSLTFFSETEFVDAAIPFPKNPISSNDAATKNPIHLWFEATAIPKYTPPAAANATFDKVLSLLVRFEVFIFSRAHSLFALQVCLQLVANQKRSHSRANYQSDFPPTNDSDNDHTAANDYRLSA